MTAPEHDRLEEPFANGDLCLWIAGERHKIMPPGIGLARDLEDRFAEAQVIDHDNQVWAEGALKDAGIDLDSLGKDDVVTPAQLLRAARQADPKEELKRTRMRQDAILDWWALVFEKTTKPTVAAPRDEWPMFLLDPTHIQTCLRTWITNPTVLGDE